VLTFPAMWRPDADGAATATLPRRVLRLLGLALAGVALRTAAPTHPSVWRAASREPT
jgi:hypothetical protein